MTNDLLRCTGEFVPYHYIGDSHSGVGNLLFETADGTRIAVRTSGIWRFVVSDMVEDDGMIAEPVMQALRRVGAFHSFRAFPPVAGLRPVLTTYGNQKQIEQINISDSANDVPYVFTVGEINARYVLRRLVGDGIDFAVPFPTAGIAALSSQSPRQVLSAPQMLRLLAQEYKPLFDGLRILRDAGLRSLFLHSLPPPAVDDADSERVLLHPSPGRLRYKLAMFINYLYKAVCKELDVGFINMWPLVTHENVLRPEFYFDGLHLNRSHSILSVQEVHRQFTRLRTALQKEVIAS